MSAKIFLGFTSNLISSGVREHIRYLVQHRMVDVLVTTAGGVEEDLIKVPLPATTCLPATFAAGCCGEHEILSAQKRLIHLEELCCVQAGILSVASGCALCLGSPKDCNGEGARLAGAQRQRMLCVQCLGPTYTGDFHLRGADLRKRGLNRVGNLLVPNSNYCAFEDWIMPILDALQTEQEQEGARWTPSKVWSSSSWMVAMCTDQALMVSCRITQQIFYTVACSHA